MRYIILVSYMDSIARNKDDLIWFGWRQSNFGHLDCYFNMKQGVLP